MGQDLRNCGINKIVVTHHAAIRWSQRINKGEILSFEEISLLLTLYLESGHIEQIGPKDFGIFCANNEIVFCGVIEQDKLVIETFIGRRSASPALYWNPAATITWHKKQRRMEMAAYTRAV